MLARILYLILLLTVIWWLPWWVVAALGLVGMFRFFRYYELVFPAFILDSVWGGGFGFTIAALALVYLIDELKSDWLFHSL